MNGEGELMTDYELESLFSDTSEEQEKEPGKTPENKEEPDKEKDTHTEEKEETVDPEGLFEIPDPESVGVEENEQGKKGAASEQNTSPIYSSLAKVLQEDGILYLDEGEADTITDVDAMKGAIRKAVESQLTDVQKRVNEALENGMDPNSVKAFENKLKFLNGITPEAIKEEGDKGDDLRKRLIYQDYLDKGFSQERAMREMQRSIDNGTDVEDAEEALKSIKELTQSKYDGALAEAKKEADAERAEETRQAKELQENILKEAPIFGDVTVDKATRQKILDTIVKPVYKDPETGYTYTALQKFEREHRMEFLKIVGAVMVLTDYGKNLDGLVKGKVKKEVGKSVKELENAINTTRRNSDGSLRFATGVSPESHLSNFTLDV